MVKEPNPQFAIEVSQTPGGETLSLCFQCGTCTGSCPSGRLTSYRTRKLIRKAQLGLEKDVLESPDLWMCTTCYACQERCPRGVEIVDIINVLRNKAVKQGVMSGEHIKVGNYLLQNGATVPLNEKYEAVREELGLSRRPANVLGDKKALEDFQKILKATGFDKLLEEKK
ncbi:MAG: CoB--CoM heterodisulfide reductase subunit C [Methanomassiliicoccaceae archaeon]|jgi:heterodisulfide reductase subunit C|nr:CoB--CoM heterodisulfide reductase subunit C [Methanomassiliicoccaceae archaeon]HQA21542.1 CoB--CoM heterodisulfide reductase subunit C [Methanomassiliicoccaceae archaeon]